MPRWSSGLRHRLFKPRIAGSNPARGTIISEDSMDMFHWVSWYITFSFIAAVVIIVTRIVINKLWKK